MATARPELPLPAHCSWWRDRHGRWRCRHRKAGQPTFYFKAEVGTPEWLAEYRQYEGSGPGSAPGSLRPRFAAGTLGDLIARYYRSQDFCNQGEVSSAKSRAVIEAFRAGRDQRLVSMLGFEHIDAIIARTAAKRASPNGKRMLGGPAAAQRLRKQLRRLFEHAVRIGMIRVNPVELTARVKYRSSGFHTWTEDEIAQYRKRHPLGSKGRLALEIILWTGQRRGDAHRFGPGHVRGGLIRFEQEKKGGKEIGLPMAPQLAAAIAAMPSVGIKTFLVTEAGKPFTKAGFGNWFRDRCDEAGLKHCTAHGLRKALARRLAENGASQKMIKAVGDWTNDSQVATYTADADQALLAAAALNALAAWESGKDGD